MTYALDAVYKADCVVATGQLSPESVDLVFADPPFNIGYAYDTYKDAKKDRDYLDWSKRWLTGVARVLKPHGTFWLAIGDAYAAELKVMATRELGLTCRSWVVWYYTFGVNCAKKFSRSHTHLLYFVKDPQRFTFNEDVIRVPSARQLVYADRRANAKGRLPDDTWILRPQDIPESFTAIEDTWYVPRVCGTFKERAGWHGCQMPEQILGRIIRACSKPGDVVLDPFAGSGTTLAVAKKLHRKWIGFDVSRQYVNRTRARLSSTCSGDSLDGFDSPTISAPKTPISRRSARTRRSEIAETSLSAANNSQLGDSIGRIAVANGELLTATTEAFLNSNQGYSIDRVIADPSLNESFLQACRMMGIRDQASVINHRLLGLRKSGKLQYLPKPRRTSLSWEDMDPFIFASEIAWQLLASERIVSLDDILCDPVLASEFDMIAGRFAPGWSSFQYRWGAMTLRKKAAWKQSRMRKLPARIKKHSFRRAAKIEDAGKIPNCGGLYTLEGTQRTLYLGETLRLDNRIEKHIEKMDDFLPAIKCDGIDSRSVRIRMMPLRDVDLSHRFGLHALLLAKKRPIANRALVPAAEQLN